MENNPNSESMDIEAIKEILPHRYPFLFVDRILYVDHEKAVGIKNVSMSEPFFQGHFPKNPVMPGVLLAEAMAQVAGIVALRRAGRRKGTAYLAGLDEIRFREPVLPGDQLCIETKIIRDKAKVHFAEGVIKVNGKIVCEGQLLFILSTEGVS